MTPVAGSRSGAGPLEGLRVVDLSTVFAAPYMGALLRDLGAEVIKVEPPSKLDQTRGGAFGPYLDNDPREDGWNWSGTFASLNRGKRSLAIDMKQEKGRAVFRRLADSADVLIDNFTPRVMSGWGLTYTELEKTNPRLVMLSNTGYGSSGPWASFKAQGTTLEATMGLTQYSGYEGDAPKKVGQSYPDFLAAWTGLFAIHSALLERELSGRGQWIDLGMYQLGAVVVPEALIAAQAGEQLEPRIGNREHDTLFSGIVSGAGDDEWLAVAVRDDASARVLLDVVGAAGADPSDRHGLERALVEWSADRDPRDAAQLLQQRGIAASHVARVRDLLLDEHLIRRHFFEWIPVRDSERPVLGTPYRWEAATTVAVRGPAPHFGEGNDELLHGLGYDAGDIAGLKGEKVVADAPIGIPRPGPQNIEALVRGGMYRFIDSDLHEVLDRARNAQRAI
jgi:crotonobetainyl-CoA:carnitine CoA-transferase CaiB-like acyl-CoA transferase